MKLYGNPHSTCTRKVLTTLAEISLPYEFILIDMAKGEHKSPEHLVRQPFGQVPVIDDDGFQLYESRAICRYLNDKTRAALIPTSLTDRARMEQWISIETSNFSGHAMKFIFQHVFKRPQPQEVLDAARKQLDVTLDAMDARLGAQPYFAGKEFSLADISFMPYVEYALVTPLKEPITGRKNVHAWWTRVSERPSWRKVVARQ